MSSNIFKLEVDEKDRPLILTIYFAFFTSGLLTVMMGSLLPYIQQTYGINYSQAGFLQSSYQMGNLFAVLLAGILPYLVGRKKSTLLLGSGIIVGFTLMTMTDHLFLLTIAFIATGLSRGTMSNICNTVISEKVKNKTQGLNLLHAIFAIGALLSAPLLIFCTKYFYFGWRGGPWSAVILGIVVLILIGRSTLSSTPSKKEKEKITDFLRTKSFIINTAILFFYLCSETSMIGWFVVYFKDMGVFSETVSAMTPTLLWLMIMIGRLITATISGKVDKNKYSLGLGISFTSFFILLLANISPQISIIALLGIGISMSGIYPTTFATMDHTSSTAVTGACMAIASIGGILMPGIVGVIAQERGLFGGVAAIGVTLGCMIVLMIIKLFMLPTQKARP